MDTIDTRDLNERLEELESIEADWTEYLEEDCSLRDQVSQIQEGLALAEGPEADEMHEELVALESDIGALRDNSPEEFTKDEEKELTQLRELRDEIGDEFRHGVALIPESDFEEYAQELADDLGVLDTDNTWPLYCIDWEYAARELKHDYCPIQVDGVWHLYRA